ncbi:S8 family serine peptidase [Halobellus rufus]|uniref:S8 family serine peptidase n=1 Tax=Halobellus rufus TaxID=1448860 RepID=UPI0006789D0D|nr:S8 family serine peptidase [Halobellus rufus]
MTNDPRTGRGLTVSRRRALAIGSAAAATLLSVGEVPALGSVGSDDRSREDADSIERIHSLGITGEGVRVAVLDPTGFDPTHAALGGAVEEVRQFGSERAVVDGASHGTAAAASVVSLAPDARLSLASFRRTGEFVEAIDWARSRGVDAVLTPVAAYGSRATRRSAVFRAARRAVEDGCAFVAPTGNAALGHWQAPYAALAADESGERRRLRVGNRVGSSSPRGRFVAWLTVEPSIDVELTLALLRAVDGGERWNLVSVSTPAGPDTGKRLAADLSDGTYALVVRPATRGETDTSATDQSERELAGRVEITTPTHLLASPRSAGSIAVPASVPGVIAVGVTDDAQRATSASATGSGSDPTEPSVEAGVSPHSGRGPTASGAVGVDVVAPPSPWVGGGTPGTSAAAARAAGAVALVLDAVPDLTPSDVVGILRASAGDVGPTGRDLAAGSGRLDVVAAVQRARSR